jgi:hypothetical protein
MNTKVHSSEYTSDHPFDSDFLITKEQKQSLRRDGFVKLEGFLNSIVVDTLLDRVEVEMGRTGGGNFRVDSQLSRAAYDFEGERVDVYELLERPHFRCTLTELAERDLFLTSELCSEIEKNVSTGFPWHIGAQTFGFQVAEEFGCTLWVPLHPVDPAAQRGGMAYVPQHVVSGDFVFHQIEPAVVSTLRAKERSGVRTTISEYLSLRSGVLNSPAIVEILDNHRVENEFKPGDALLFNKMVIHRSVMLGEGPLPRHAAYVMRFVDAGSHYDLERARNLEFPVEKYGRGLFPDKPFGRQHIEIAEAGAVDGDPLAECAYFDNRDRRTLRRARPGQHR